MSGVIKKLFAGRTTYSIEGLNLRKLLQEIIKSGIDVYDYREPKIRKITFSVDNRDRVKLIALCKKMCYNPSVENAYGFGEVLRGARFRLGLVIGLVLLTAAVCLFNSFIWAIDISGTDRILKSDVMKLLNESGIKRGAARNKIDSKMLSDTITASFADASMVYVKTRGTTLKIQIVETLYKDGIIDRETPSSITASYEGRVDKISAYAGTPLVTPGSIVKKGQVLIANYEDKLLPDGVTVERIFKKALGEIEMTVWYTEETVFYESLIEYTRTGNTATSSELRLFGAVFGKKGGNPFALYESVSRTDILFEANMVPLKRYVTVYYEIEKKEINRVFAEEEATLKYKALSGARLKVPEGAVITDEYTDVSGAAGVYRITGVIGTKVRIGG